MFLASEGKLRMIASSGMKAPVILGGIGVFAEFEAVSLNSRGDVAFFGILYRARKVGAVHQLHESCRGRRAGSRRRLPRWLRRARRQRHGRRCISGRGQAGPGARCYLCRARRGARASARYGRSSAGWAAFSPGSLKELGLTIPAVWPSVPSSTGVAGRISASSSPTALTGGRSRRGDRRRQAAAFMRPSVVGLR